MQTNQLNLSVVLCAIDQFIAVMLYLLRHKGLDLLLQFCILFDGTMDCSGKIRCIVKQTAQTVEHILGSIIEFVGFRSSNRLYTAHSGRYAGLHNDAHRAYLTC